MVNNPSFQDQMPDNYCWGCGSLNEHGLGIKSYWSGDESVCTWQPAAQFMAGPRHILNGGIIASLIDCYCVCLAVAAAYRQEGRAISVPPAIWYVTASLRVSYRMPTPIDEPVTLRARITGMTQRRTNLTCSLSSNGSECATGTLVAVRVPPEWLAPPP